jgi:hypothetical protein
VKDAMAGVGTSILIVLGIILTGVYTILAYQWFGVTGVVVGWFTMLIPTAAYITGLPAMLLFAGIAAALDRD